MTGPRFELAADDLLEYLVEFSPTNEGNKYEDVQ